MPLVKFPTIPPYNEVIVNSEEIIAAFPKTSTQEVDTELLADGPRQIVVLVQLDQVAQKLGAEFVRFDAASTSHSTVYVNKRMILHLLPHPQVPGVVQIHGNNRVIPVKGTLQDVAQKLA